MRKGGLSRGSYSSDTYRLENFLRQCRNENKAKLSSIVTAGFLGAYRTKLLDAVARNRQSPEDAKHHLRTVKALLKWGYEQERLDTLPRNLLSAEFAKVDIKPPSPKTFTLVELRTLYAKANGRMRLWLLLGLNCGYLQADIASLSHEMVDWKLGTIRRSRQKTGVDSEHKLWPEALRLLREYATDPTEHPDTLLLNSHGHVLYAETRKDDGKVTKKDTIGHAFKRLANDAGVRLTFKHLRKTAASAIEREYQKTPHVAKLYLSHDIRGIQQHYTEQSYELLHAATDWLCEYLALSDGESKSSLTGNNSQ